MNIRKFWYRVRNLLFPVKYFPYHIEAIDMDSQMVIIRCRSKRSLIKLTIEEAVFDQHLVEGISPNQAGFLGGHYGRSLRKKKGLKSSFKKTRNYCFSLKDSNSRYKILYQTRDGNIGYVDTLTNDEYLEHPLSIIEAMNILKDFNPIQSCYLGVLAGIQWEKVSNQQENSPKSNCHKINPVHLRVVK